METLSENSSTDKEKVIQALDCHYCVSAGDAAEYFYYAPLENIITWFPDKHLIHIHFGKPTWNDETALKEAEWLRDSCLKAYEKSQCPLFAIADFSRVDDSEFPTREAIRIYAESAAHEMTAHVVCYGVAMGMRMILKLISSVSTAAAKISFGTNLDKAMQEFEEWSKTQS